MIALLEALSRDPALSDETRQAAAALLAEERELTASMLDAFSGHSASR
jgi:hypothetical protein